MAATELVSYYLQSVEYITRAQIVCIEYGEQLRADGMLIASRCILHIGEQLCEYRKLLDEYEIFHNCATFWEKNPACARYVEDLIGVKI